MSLSVEGHNLLHIKGESPTFVLLKAQLRDLSVTRFRKVGILGRLRSFGAIRAIRNMAMGRNQTK